MLQTALQQFSSSDWSSALDALGPDMHEVDRDATRIWCAFFPLALAEAYSAAADGETVTRRLRIDGNARLSSGQIDSSHWFLFGHRYWPIAKAVVIARAEADATVERRDLPGIVREITADIAARTHADPRLVSGITFVALMTLRQVGLVAFRASDPAPEPGASSTDAPDARVARRARDDGQGAFGFLRSTRRFSVTFDERRADGKFPIVDSQHLTTAAAADRRDYTQGPRRFQEGPIPAQCRSATCGTCWVGVLGGRDKLNAIEPYEARRLRAFGYIDPQEPHPIIRLACQARASGNVTIVIPPWHGFVSRLEPSVPAAAAAGVEP